MMIYLHLTPFFEKEIPKFPLPQQISKHLSFLFHPDFKQKDTNIFVNLSLEDESNSGFPTFRKADRVVWLFDKENNILYVRKLQIRNPKTPM